MKKSYADSIPFEKRKKFFESFSEVQLHPELKNVLSGMNPNAIVHVTHGTYEYGKDLIVINDDPINGRNCTAFVVKKGRIDGKTDGIIDEIKSQVQQCFDMPAKIPNSTDIIVVSKVVVVIFGDMSNQAESRYNQQIENVYKHSLNTWFLDKITENFSKYYPELFIGGEKTKYIFSLIDDIKKSKDFHADESMFISPLFKDELREQKDIYTVKRPEKKKREKLKIFAKQFFGETINYPDFYKILDTSTKIAVLGEAGSGKSYIFKKIVVDMLHHQVNNLIPEPSYELSIPVLLKAVDFDSTANIENLLENTLQKYHDAGINKFSHIFLDGLDEIRQENACEIVEYLQSYCNINGIKFIVSLRKTAHRDCLTGYKEYTILPLNKSQIISYVSNLKNLTDLTLHPLRDGIDKLQTQLPLYPLSFWILIKLVEQSKEVPASITEIYSQYIDLALGKYDIEKGVNIFFDYKIKKFFIRRLAYSCFYKKDTLKIERREFDEFLSEYTREHRNEISSTANFIAELDRSGIIIFDNGFVRFSHKSFLDFFIALNQHEKPSVDVDDLMVENYFSPQWEDVAYFYFGLKTEINTTIVDKIMCFSSPDGDYPTDKFFIGKLLQYAWHTDINTVRTALNGGLGYSKQVIGEAREEIRSRFPAIKFNALFDNAALYKLFDYCYKSMVLYDELKLMLFDNIDDLISMASSLDKTEEDDLRLILSSVFIITYRDYLDKNSISNYINKVTLNSDKIQNKAIAYSLVGLIDIGLKKKYFNITESDLETVLRGLKKLSKKFDSIFFDEPQKINLSKTEWH